MTRTCDLYPCFKKGDGRAIVAAGKKLTRNELLKGQYSDGKPIPAGTVVDVIDAQGRSISTTVEVVTGLLSGKDLGQQTRQIIPANGDPARAEGGHLHGYYERLNAQHFDTKTSVGSVFTEVNSVEELAELAVLQGRDLATADDSAHIAAMLAAQGWPQDEIAATLRSDVRYVLLFSPGANGLADVRKLLRTGSNALTVRATRAKPGVPLSLTVGCDDAHVIPRTYEPFSTMVIGPDPKDPTVSRLFTAHPGLPVRSATGEPVDVSGQAVEEGEEMTLREFAARFPDRDFLKIDAERVAPLDPQKLATSARSRAAGPNTPVIPPRESIPPVHVSAVLSNAVNDVSKLAGVDLGTLELVREMAREAVSADPQHRKALVEVIEAAGTRLDAERPWTKMWSPSSMDEFWVAAGEKVAWDALGRHLGQDPGTFSFDEPLWITDETSVFDSPPTPGLISNGEIMVLDAAGVTQALRQPAPKKYEHTWDD
jgi:hypothetical protein